MLYIDGMGYLLHHAAASFIMTGLSLGLFTMTRALVSPSIMIILQHTFVLLKYRLGALYMIVEMSLEFIFEWEVNE